MTEQKSIKKINAKAIMTDLKEGLSDTDLMAKYDLSFQALQDLFAKLVEARLATKAYFEKRAKTQVAAQVNEQEAATCPYCGYTAEAKFERCPRCNQDTAEWLDTVELTKILTGSFD